MPSFDNGHALIIGIANYPNVRQLPATVLKDACDIHDLLISASHCGYLAANTQLLIDKQATLDNIRDGMRWLAQNTGPRDTAIVFFSGHGGRLTSGPQAVNYLIPYNCDPSALTTTALSGQQFTELLQNIKAQRLLVLFDACYSGGTGEAKDLVSEQLNLKSGLDEQIYTQLAQGTGRVIMASSRTDEVSLVLGNMENSLFTYYLLDALRGSARTRNDGLLRIFDIFEYVSEQVPAHGNQHPIFKAADLENNFPISLYVGGKQSGSAVSLDLSRKTAVDKRALREAIMQSFKLDEIETLCQDIQQELANDGIQLQLNLEVIGGEGKEGQIRELINYLDRRQYVSYLVRVARLHRPGVI